MQYINVKGYADELLDCVADEPKRGRLCIITPGTDQASESYIKGKVKDCQRCGVDWVVIYAKTHEQLCHYIKAYNEDHHTAGIIVQLPLPFGLDAELYTGMICDDKDVDGFKENSPFEPCTPEGIMYILQHEVGVLEGKRALIIGRGDLVGIPMLARLLNANCTVTIAHSKTTNLDELLTCNDIIISAAGKAGLVDLLKCHDAEIVIDVGVNRDENGKLCGDCYNFSDYYLPDLKVTPVPGGIGLMTRAMLMEHMSMYRRAD